ncbi:MAG: amidohydrolase family protein [Armatimonadetes bacterium]|nr:amidohydrolase family protein [Armatimonadota bacterium]NIM23478.1 amidohydrolase family protein [Armatimonadota bacterium]NIM67344.1 amidohydrolase family protein [Armatimonadota bacterium]NIM75845.1 amidohydrolase family protein [Armatimonadota bacterium]NIN05530.1 amidohydrolase family protein [Armatimonadota bacterium]
MANEGRKYDILDCHTHLLKKHDAQAGTRLLARAAEGGIETIALLSLGEMKWENENPAALVAKAAHPDRIFLFAALDYSALNTEVEHTHTLPFGEQARRLMEMGCDGMKMINGKPDARRASGIALDSPIYDGFFQRLEEDGIPLLWHVVDPEEFWDAYKAPEWAKAPGWIYDENFPTKESIYGECHRVLERHPNLKVIFAHFHFLSADLPRAGALLERFPSVSLDLAPGIEMFHNFSANPEAAREFFIHHQDRIIFGTDLVEDSPLSRIEVVRRCLETDDTFHVPKDEPLFWPDHRTTLRGLQLPEDALKKVYGENFRRLVGEKPRPLDGEKVRAELERLAAIAVQLGTSPDRAREALQVLA